VGGFALFSFGGGVEKGKIFFPNAEDLEWQARKPLEEFGWGIFVCGSGWLVMLMCVMGMGTEGWGEFSFSFIFNFCPIRTTFHVLSALLLVCAANGTLRKSFWRKVGVN